MATIQATGLSGEWRFVGGHLCVDFVNSVSGRRAPLHGRESLIIGDRLLRFSDLVDWAVARGALPARAGKLLLALGTRKRNDAGGVLQRARALRESLFRILTTRTGPLDADIRILNEECGRARRHERLVRTTGGFRWELRDMDSSLESVLWVVALSASDLLLSEERSLVDQCRGPDCGWLFLDTSKNKSRHWCEMRTCGTVEKVRRFRARQRKNL